MEYLTYASILLLVGVVLKFVFRMIRQEDKIMVERKKQLFNKV